MEQLLSSARKSIFIPARQCHALLHQEFQKESPSFLEFLPDQSQQKQEKLFTNGEINPLFIVFDFDYEPSREIIKYLSYQTEMLLDGQQIKIYPSYRDSSYHIETQLDYQKLASQIVDSRLILCIMVPLCLPEDCCDKNIFFKLTLQYQFKDHFGDTLFKTIFRNEVPTEKHKILSFHFEFDICVSSPISISYSYKSTTSKAHLRLQINQHQEVEILRNDLKINESQMVWKDVNVERVVPSSMLKHIQVQKKYIHQNEGFVEIGINWPAMLESQESQTQLPMRRQSIIAQIVDPILEIKTPFFIVWSQKGSLVKSYRKFELEWKIKPINQIGAEVVEAIRYDFEGIPYLALRLKILNYTNKAQEVTFLPPTQIFGKKFRQSKQNDPAVVLGISLTVEKNLGVIESCGFSECILRLQLINYGILNLQTLDFRIGNKVIPVEINFLHSYQ